MPRCRIAGLISGAALAAAAVAAPALAAEHPCFNSREVRDWSALGDQTVLLRVRADDYYRLDLSRPVKHIRSRSAHLALVSRDQEQICNVGDLDTRIMLSPDFSMALPVASLHQLSQAEQAAIGETNLPGRHYRRRSHE